MYPETQFLKILIIKQDMGQDCLSMNKLIKKSCWYFGSDSWQISEKHEVGLFTYYVNIAIFQTHTGKLWENFEIRRCREKFSF